MSLRPSRLLACAALALLAACTTVPYTQRSQIMLVSEAQEMSLGANLYQQILSQSDVERTSSGAEVVERVGRRIAAVANRPDFDWEFSVIDDPSMVNAFALPGGKVAVYTGLFPVAQDEAGLAVVMGHEVAHALARHSGERMSQDLLLQVGATGLSVAAGDSSPATRTLLMQAFGLGAQLGVVLPFGRSQESEADHIGLILMAKAGYDPQAAIGLWERMEQANERVPPEFLSTHPSYGTRRDQIRKWLPEAMSYYTPAQGVTNAKLPAAAAQGAGQSREEAVLSRLAGNIDARGKTAAGARTMTQAISAVLGVSPQVIEQRRASSRLGLGPVAVASILAQSTRRPFDEVARSYASSRSWAKVAGPDALGQAVGVLQRVMQQAVNIEARTG